MEKDQYITIVINAPGTVEYNPENQHLTFNWKNRPGIYGDLTFLLGNDGGVKKLIKAIIEAYENPGKEVKIV